MKSKSMKSRGAENLRRPAWAMAAAMGMAGLLGVSALGCDTAARISFPKRSFQKIESSGFTARAGACQGVSDGDMAVRFVLLDNESSPIRLGDPINSPSGGTQAVELNAQSIQLSNAAIIDAKSNRCGSGGDACPSEPFRFTCQAAPGLNASGDDLKSCLIEDANMEIVRGGDSVRFVSDLDQDQFYGVLMAANGTLDGWNLPGTEGMWDRDGDGQFDGPQDLAPGGYQVRDIATDLKKNRNAGLDSAYSTWKQVAKQARATKRKTYFGLWSFKGSANITTHVDREGFLGTPWTSDPTPAEIAIEDYKSNVEIRASYANVYEAIISVLTNAYNDEAIGKVGVAEPASAVRQLVVFVDGADDMRLPSKDIDEVIRVAKENRVRVFLVQLDAAVKRPAEIRDNPRYWEDQASTCNSDADCKNYETCRKPRGYWMGSPSDPITGVPADSQATYCLIKRDEDTGRIGPIHDYARLACETEGGYMYVPSADAIERNLLWTPYALDGLWEAQVNSSEMGRKASLDGAALKIHADMRVTVAGEAHNYSFSQVGATSTSSDTGDDALDNRSVVFGAR